MRVYRISAGDRRVELHSITKEADEHPNTIAIAVLLSENMSGDPEHRYFSDGITEDIIRELVRFASLDAVARNSTFFYRDKAADINALGKALGAAFLLEGRLRKAGNRRLLTAQLIKAETGKHVWADRYDGELRAIFAIQDELVHAIVATLADRLTAAETARSMRKPPDSLDAYDYYLMALGLDRNNYRESHYKAEKLLEKAIGLDPAFARAYALLSAQIWTITYFDDIVNEPYAEAAVKMARQVVQLDPDDSSAIPCWRSPILNPGISNSRAITTNWR